MSKPVDNPRNLCFHMLTEVFENQSYSNLVIQKMLPHSSLSPQDKSFAVALFYGTITRLYTLDYYLSRVLHQKIDTLDPAVRTILRMGIWQILYAHSVPSFAAVDEMVSLSGLHTHEGGVRLVNAVLRAISRDYDSGKIQPDKSRFDVRFSLSKELSGCLIKWYGQERAQAIAEAFLQDAVITARVNTTIVTPEKIVELLKDEGVTASPGLFMDEAVRLLLEGKSIRDLKSFEQGLFMIQDEAAMLATHLMSVQSGDRILDVCAAPGGKSCHMAERMNNNGYVLAVDIHASRLELITENANRLGLTCIETKAADATALIDSMPEQIGSFDNVLVDVPCSGLGLLLRKPDIRMSMTYQKMQELILLQERILQEASAFVAPGGTLLYSTCTINPNENEKQAEKFLANNCEFVIYPFDDILPSRLAVLSETVKSDAMRGSLQLLPDVIACDGFYIARFRRKQNDA
jgi:16S rRNA (cytosine967-C5)-methyltransferase